MKLSERMFENRTDRPDEWSMDDYSREAKKLEGKIAQLENQWISVEDRLPAYGAPILLSISGVVQHVTYMVDGADETPDWFEPYNFEHDDNCKLFWNKAQAWQPLPTPPKETQR